MESSSAEETTAAPNNTHMGFEQNWWRSNSRVEIDQICTQRPLHWRRCNRYCHLQQITKTDSRSCTSTCLVLMSRERHSDECS